MVTVKEMLLVLEELKMKEHIWHSIKEYLEAYLPEGSVDGKLQIDGVTIPESSVIDVLGDIDQMCLDPIRERIQRIEGSGVNEPEKEKRQAPRSSKTRRNKADEN